MEEREQFAQAYASMWEGLTEEQRKLILQMQADEKRKAAAKAKKENTQRMLDKQDRKRVETTLQNAGCSDVKLSLTAARVLALRWVLSDDELCGRFGSHVKRQIGQ